MSKIRLNDEIPRDLKSLEELCVKIRKRFIDQIDNGRATFRSLGEKTGVSYETIRTLYNDRTHPLNRKSMIRLVRTCTRRDLFQTVKIIHKEKGIFTCPK